MPNMKILDRSIPTWITVFLIIHKVDLKFKTYPNNSMIESINLQDLGEKELVLVCRILNVSKAAGDQKKKKVARN